MTSTGVTDLVVAHKSVTADLPSCGQVMEALQALPKGLHTWWTCRFAAALDPAAELAYELDHFAYAWGVGRQGLASFDDGPG